MYKPFGIVVIKDIAVGVGGFEFDSGLVKLVSVSPMVRH